MMLACRSSCSSNMTPGDASCGTLCLAAISDGSIPLPFFNSILNMDCLHPQERLRRKAGAEPPFGKRPYPPPDEVNSRNVNLMGRPSRALEFHQGAPPSRKSHRLEPAGRPIPWNSLHNLLSTIGWLASAEFGGPPPGGCPSSMPMAQDASASVRQ